MMCCFKHCRTIDAGASVLFLSAVMLNGNAAYALDSEVYGSLRLTAEAVDPDGGSGSYTEVRDLFSRVGVSVEQQMDQNWALSGKLELPVDALDITDRFPYRAVGDTRVAKLQLSGPIGTAWFGKGWVPYYNYIAYPLDYFTSYYSGWATPSAFRLEDTLYYETPLINGIQLALSTSKDNGTSADHRNQYALSYTSSGLVLALGYDDLGETANRGGVASYTTGSWYVAAKHEKDTGDNRANNLLIEYALNSKDTVRGMVADYEGHGDQILHIGWDHQYSDDLRFFLEYYSEQSTEAISGKSGSAAPDSGGALVTTGVRYDFKLY